MLCAYRLPKLRNQLLSSDVLLEVWMSFTTSEVSLSEWNFWVILYNTRHTLYVSLSHFHCDADVITLSVVIRYDTV